MYCLPIDDQCAIQRDFERFIAEERVANTPINFIEMPSDNGKTYIIITNPFNGQVTMLVKDKIGEYLQSNGNYFDWKK